MTVRFNPIIHSLSHLLAGAIRFLSGFLIARSHMLCPLCVISGYFAVQSACPLYSRQRILKRRKTHEQAQGEKISKYQRMSAVCGRQENARKSSTHLPMVFPAGKTFSRGPTVKLTQKAVAVVALSEGKTETIVFDQDLPGFGIRIRAGGSRTWIYQFKVGSQHRRITLGNAAALSPVRAREMATEMHAAVRLGRDPAGEKSEGRARAAETLAAVVQSYLTYQSGHLRRRSYTEVERHLLRYCKPLHGLQLAKIDRRTVAAVVSAVSSDSGPATGNRVRASLSALFSWAMRQGLCDSNPIAGTQRAPEKARERVLSSAELEIIWGALDQADYSAIIKLLILTGCRRDEIGSLSWSEITDDRIVLPPQRTKNGREHIIPITPAVRVILDGRERNGAFVFGRHAAKPFSGWGVSKAGLDRRIKAAGHQLSAWKIHDLRRTMRTGLGKLGVAPHVAELTINHARRGIETVYDKYRYEGEIKTALTLWADCVLSAVEGHERKVVPLRGA
jgi:integrase